MLQCELKTFMDYRLEVMEEEWEQHFREWKRRTQPTKGTYLKLDDYRYVCFPPKEEKPPTTP